jgi:hypothetical protein
MLTKLLCKYNVFTNLLGAKAPFKLKVGLSKHRNRKAGLQSHSTTSDPMECKNGNCFHEAEKQRDLRKVIRCKGFFQEIGLMLAIHQISCSNRPIP